MRRTLRRAPAGSLLLLVLASVGCDNARPVQIPLEGRTLAALYWEPSKLLSPSVLLVAPPGQGKESWVLLGARLRKQGYGVLALEVSGGGASVNELRAAFEYLRLRKKVDAARIGLVGADQGANAALEFAAREPMVRLVVMLSPATEADESPLRDYGFRPLLLVHNGTPAGGLVVEWQKAASLGAVLRRVDDPQDSEDELVAFLARHL